MTPPGVAPSQVGWCDIRGRKLLPQQPQHGKRLEKVNFKKNIWNRYETLRKIFGIDMTNVKVGPSQRISSNPMTDQ